MAVVAQDDKVQIRKLTLGPWGTNVYIIVCQETQASLVVDAPADASAIVSELKGTSPKYVLLTHNHLDHIGAMAELRNKLKVPLSCHSSDTAGLASPPEKPLKDGDELSLGSIKIGVLHTPGHTPGSLCFRLGRYLVSGDTIFPGGPGKTRSSGDFRQIVQSLKDKIFVLSDDTAVYPGHGEPTVLKKEKDEFNVFSSRPHGPDLHGDVTWLSA
jgi:glyoxylase-like metal-dependent hydrolase (beta-lactamase superfamily II)